MNRRTLLKALAACSGSLLLEGCAAKRVHPPLNSAPVSQLHLPKVLVSAEREIRTTVCLRPFRAPGFRLEAEKLDDKLCVHNYGHGGAGITLSWGTAQLATEEVRKSGQKQVAVLGCGVVGLATARLLQQIGKEVTIYAKALPPETTSNSAGGLWLPYSLFDPDRETRELQKLGDFDTKTSSWVKTPSDIRKLGGALFCDRRYDTVFVYHNGAESYYAARAFRGSLRV